MAEEKKSANGSRKANVSRFLANLAGLLENPVLKSLQWDEIGKAVVVNAKLYEEEIEEHGDLLSELRNFRTISMLHGLLCTFGFKKKIAKADAEVHVFQHVDFKKAAPVKPQVDCNSFKMEAATKQPKKSKKRKKESMVDFQVPLAKCVPSHPSEQQGLEKRPQHVRALYQYINYNNPEMNSKSDGETDTEETEAPGGASEEHSIQNSQPLLAIPQTGMKEDTLKTMKSLSLGRQVKPELDKSTKLDIDKMLSACASHLVPPLSPQYK